MLPIGGGVVEGGSGVGRGVGVGAGVGTSVNEIHGSLSSSVVKQKCMHLTVIKTLQTD